VFVLFFIYQQVTAYGITSFYYLYCMNTEINIAELKLHISRQIDALNPSALVEINKLLDIFLEKQEHVSDEWNDTSEKEKYLILQALEEISRGEVFSHENVMKEFREKYGKE